jgi:hypothetical protein
MVVVTIGLKMVRFVLKKNGVNAMLCVMRLILGATRQVGLVTAMELGIIVKIIKRQWSVAIRMIVVAAKDALAALLAENVSQLH